MRISRFFAFLENFILEIFLSKGYRLTAKLCHMACNYIVHMGILKHFKHDSTLPSLSRPLLKVVQCEGIKAANKELSQQSSKWYEIST